MTAEIDTLFSLIPILAGLAIVDSLSLGTLAVPVWLLSGSRRSGIGSVVLYLLTLAGFYLLVGVALLLGLQFLLDWIDLDEIVLRSVLFVVGVALVVLSFLMDPQRRGRTGEEARRPRLLRWRDRILDAPRPGSGEDRGGGARAVVGLALMAGGLELVTMVPYLGAMGVLSGAPLPLPLQIAALAGYCLVMILPALVLALLRLILHRVMAPILQRLDGWFLRHGASATAWLIGIVGVILMIHNWTVVRAHWPVFSILIST